MISTTSTIAVVSIMPIAVGPPTAIVRIIRIMIVPPIAIAKRGFIVVPRPPTVVNGTS